MKAIVLYTACVDNGGARKPAGAEIAVGVGADQISPARAGDLIKRCLAADKLDKKAAADVSESKG